MKKSFLFTKQEQDQNYDYGGAKGEEENEKVI